MSRGQPAGRQPLQPIGLRELRLRSDGQHWLIDQPIAGLDSLTPVRGELLALHHGNVLELQSKAETIVTLCCDRCLQAFNQPLRLAVRELLELEASPADGPGETMAMAGRISSDSLAPRGDDLDDRLTANGVFDPERWLFEQLQLLLPPVNHCGAACPGPARWSVGAELDDPRWAALRTLRSS